MVSVIELIISYKENAEKIYKFDTISTALSEYSKSPEESELITDEDAYIGKNLLINLYTMSNEPTASFMYVKDKDIWIDTLCEMGDMDTKSLGKIINKD